MSVTREKYIHLPSPIEAELLRVFDRSDPLVIFDIGSCEGEDAIRYSRLFPKSAIYAFEPLPSNVEMIRKNIKNYNSPNVHVVKQALGATIGKSKFYVSSGAPPGSKNDDDWNFGNKSSSLFKPNLETMPEWLDFEEVIDVQINTVNNFCEVNSIDRIDFIHLDVQGAELDVLDGASNVLSKTSLIWMEVENTELYRGQPLKPEVEKFMYAQGFAKVVDTVNHVSGDQLYVSQDLAAQFASRSSFLGRITAMFTKKQGIKIR